MAQIAEAESRKVVTVLFSDISGSTAIGSRLDPESFRRIIVRYFEEMKLVLERHGGTVEKFIGDAVMAVFGVPRAHEDDALRAVRAAVEMRHALDKLNEEFEPTWGVRIVTRTGVNTGEVIAGGGAFIVGDAVNVAARLEQVAPPGAILIGESTFALVRDAVTADQVGPLELKGKDEPIPAWKVQGVVPSTTGWSRRLDSPLVGRDSELQVLSEAFDRTLRTAASEVVTIIGVAGVGKSRLTEAFLGSLGARATVIRGRCLPYGEGITLWPILQVVRDAAGISVEDSGDEARSKITAVLDGADDAGLVGDRLAALLGMELTPAMQETFWGVRRLMEIMASQRPLVVFFDDIQWGEPTFLDLAEYLSSIRTTPVLLLYAARPQLLEARREWMKDRANATTLQLEPLSPDVIERLIRNLLDGSEIGPQAQRRIESVAEGNPLFVEETLRMLVDRGALRPVNRHWELVGDVSQVQIPPTIQTLLASRLDRLDEEERAVIERASIVGRVFWLDAVLALAPEPLKPVIASQLQSLVRKELVRPDFSDMRMGDAYRFSHILIRDAAYAGIPKAARAELHQRLADWIERTSRDRPIEYEEIRGYHLEQAHRALTELGMMSQEVVDLGRRASVPLVSAGLRAFARGDMPGAVNLLSRAVGLRPREDAERAELLPTLAFALMETGDFERLLEVVGEANEAAAASEDMGLKGNVAIVGLWIRLFTNPQGWADEAQRDATRVIETFRELGDQRGQAKGWAVLGLVNTMKAQFALAEEAWRRAAGFARAAEDRRDELEDLAWIPLAVWAGPGRPEDALRVSQEVTERAGGDKKVMATALFMQAPFKAGAGNIEEARDLIAQAKAILQEIELTVWIAGPLAQVAGWVELTADDPEAAERELRQGYETLQQIGDVAWLSTTVGILAEALYRLGRHDEAMELTSISEQTAAPDDVYSQVMWRSVRAKVIAPADREAAEHLAREAAAMADPSDFLHLRAVAAMSLADVLDRLGRSREAKEALREVVELFRRKGNDVEASRVEARLAESAV
jgi:class 3 adenylate cyclase/tetratricopeptide (TPR) repeat protein